MNYKLTLETSDANALARVLASIGAEHPAMQTPIDADTDDDNAPVNVNAPALDGDGVPWDARIHSSNKQLTKGGAWRKMRNVNEAEYQRITAELKSRQAGVNAVTAAGTAPPMMTPPGYPPVAIPASPPAMPAMPQPMPAPAPVAAPAPVPTPAPAAGMGFGEFMAKYTTAVNEGKCTPADLQGYLTAMAINTLGDLNSDPAKTLQLHDWMAGNGKL